MQLKEFFQTVVTGGEGNFCLALGPHNGSGWMEEWYNYPEDLDRIVERAIEFGPIRNVYFSSYLFSERSSIKENVIPSRTIQADLDEADVQQLPIVPSVLLQTSPGRHQAYWILSDGPLDKEVHEVLSRKITYSIPLCDRSGWALGRKVRVPFTNNFKYSDGPKPVIIVGDARKLYSSADFELLPDVVKAEVDRYESGFLDCPLKNGEPEVGPAELLSRYKAKLTPSATIAYSQADPKDRSKALWGLLTALFRAGASKEEVFWIARASKNNKFADLRHHADRELAKDVLRAEAVVLKNQLDPRNLIEMARRKSGPASERRALIASIVLETMKQRGSILHAMGGAAYYVPRESGRPIVVSRHSQYFDVLLDLQYGLNAVEIDTHYVASSIFSHAKNAPENASVAQLSHFLRDAHALLLHTGRKDVLRISAHSVERVTDGAYNVIFPWRDVHEPFAPRLDVSDDFDWGHFLFVETIPGVNSLENVVGLSPDEALALLKVWFMFLLFRDLSASRPILTALGQPGSGKTTLFKKLYKVLYGKDKAVSSITTPDDFDHGTSNTAFYALDNVDSWERWLPDRLALAASPSSVDKRVLFTDSDIWTMKRQALVGISAHNPKFGREDVADRMLIVMFKRLDKFASEDAIYDAIIRRRNDIWGAIVKSAQKILQTNPPSDAETPQFRIEDFAKVGLWIARALGHEAAFISGLDKTRVNQRAFTLEEDSILITAIRRVIAREPDFFSIAKAPGEIWARLEVASDDRVAFTKAYKNSVSLGKKLWSMEDALKQQFDVKWETRQDQPGRLWTIKSKGGN